ncbi:MAG TPA: hypothetical protein VFM55_20755 [Micromonosporaceae bacterium]|nr:hypothetical protein [Micromonosporaceae bacterium]
MRTRMRGRLGLAVAVLGAALVLTGCGAGENGESSAPAGGPAERGNAGAPGNQADPAQPGAGAGAPAKLNLDTRSIIYTGELTVRYPTWTMRRPGPPSWPRAPAASSARTGGPATTGGPRRT